MKNILIANTGAESKFQNLADRFQLFYDRNKKESPAFLSYMPDAGCRNDATFRYNCSCASLLVYSGFHTSDENSINISWSVGESSSNVKAIAENIGVEYKKLKFIPQKTPITVCEDSAIKKDSTPYISVDYFIKNHEDGWLRNDYIIGGFVKALINGINHSMNKLTDISYSFNSDLQASDFDEDIMKNIERIAPHIQMIQRDTGLLTSVTLAQFIVESDYGRSDIFKNSNNGFGMQSYLSGNLWYGSVWNENDYYEQFSDEFILNRGFVSMLSRFRKYESVLHSIADFSAYMLNSSSNGMKKYDGINDSEKSYAERCCIISKGSYSTNPDYSKILINTIERLDLTRYDNALR